MSSPEKRGRRMIGEKITVTVLKSLNNGYSLALDNYDYKAIFIEGDHEADSRLEVEIKNINEESIIVTKKRGVARKNNPASNNNANNPYEQDE